MLFVFFVALLMVQVSLGLPAAVPTNRSTLNIHVVEPSETLSALQKALSRLDQYINRLEQYAEVFAASQSGNLRKLSKGCSVKTCGVGFTAYSSPNDDTICTCIDNADIAYYTLMNTLEDNGMNLEEILDVRKRQVGESQPVIKNTNFTYVPPPQTDITAELLAESLTVQPQNTATVGSIFPHFQEGVISYGVQLNGLIAATMILNASTSLPCGSIGSSSEPDLVLKPAEMKNAAAQPIISDCEIIAVNMYDPMVITYWVQKHDGGIFSLAGSNKVEDIGAINAAASTALVLRAQAPGQSKRSEEHICTPDCSHMITARALDRRAISPPNVHTSTFSPEACTAITCNSNGGKPALFNPFTMTCGCPDQAFVEMDKSGVE